MSNENPNSTPEAVAQRALLASYSGKLCPYLTIAGLRQQTGPSIIGGTPGQGALSEAIGCQGPACMMFVPIGDENGRICGGGCAVSLLPTAIGQVTQALSVFTKVKS